MKRGPYKDHEVKVFGLLAIMLAGVVLVGCSTIKALGADAKEWYETQQLKRREAQEKEYKRLAALPPAQVVVKSPRRDIVDCSRQSRDLFNVAQPKMKAYITLTENSYEYRGYINDVQYYIEEEKMSSAEAQKKVRDTVIAGDANRPDGEKIWPKIVKGAEAARQFGAESEWKLFLGLRVRHLEINARLVKIIQSLNKQRKELSKAEKAKRISRAQRLEKEIELVQRLSECMAIQQQLSDSGKCISYMVEQCNRVRELEREAAR